MSSQFASTVSAVEPHHARMVQRAQAILLAEAAAIEAVSERLGDEFARAVEMILSCDGSVIVCGMGKAGIIGRKLAASFSSTGTPSHFLHPAEAVHGDLGCVRGRDVVLLLSYSGDTEEVVRLLPSLQKTHCQTLAITSRSNSKLARGVQCALLTGSHVEAGLLGLAPSTTTTSMLALGDALALVTSERRGFTREEFAQFHPGGSLGRKLTTVRQIMRPLQECRIASDALTLRQVLIGVTRPGRRTGAIMLIDTRGQLSGIFTDSDLARLLEHSVDGHLDCPIASVMSKKFTTIGDECFLPKAMQILAEKKISELPVVNEAFCPQGLVDITDVIGLLSTPAEDERRAEQTSRGAGNGPTGGTSGSMPNILSIESFRNAS